MIQKIRIILIVDPKGNLESRNADARNRHKIYGSKLQELDPSGELQLCVFTNGEFCDYDLRPEISFMQFPTKRFKFISFLYFANKEIKHRNLDVPVLISSDAWESFLVAKVLSIFCGQNLKIQIQIHADISDSAWLRSNWKNIFRKLFQHYSLKSADQIRVVSPHLKGYLESRYGIDSSKIVVAPIPVLLQTEMPKPSEKRSEDFFQFGLIGRMHWDRGVEFFPEIVQILSSQQSDFQIVLAGQGPQQKFLIDRLENLVGKKRVNYLGQLNSEDLVNTLVNLDVYFSLARSESYGLGMREAIALGVPVIALESNGSLAAQDEFGESRIRLINLPLDPEEVYLAIEWALTQKQAIGPIGEIQVASQGNTKELIDSWIRLAIS